MEILLKEIKQICSEYQLLSLQQLIISVENLFSNKYIDIAVFGQFKTGKSSFINNFLEKNILPTAVVPATSVITRIFYGDTERVTIIYNDKRTEIISINDLENYVTESKNPNNTKDVAIANIEIPEMKAFPGLCFTDTPGVGSIFLHNTETTKIWSDNASIALVCISAERPLSEFDLNLIRELDRNSYKTLCLLTKTDLFTTEQINEITNFIQTSLFREIGKKIAVFYYSIYKNSETYKQKINNEICLPLTVQFDNEIEKILKHKVITITTKLLSYIEITYTSSLKTDDEKILLKKKILDEKLNTSYIQYELRLITTDFKANVRDKIYKILELYQQDLIKEMQKDFILNFSEWKGNLNDLTKIFEDWLKSVLTERLKKILEKEKHQFEKITENINSHFSFYTRHLKERLSENIFRVLGMKLAVEEWNPEFQPLKQPDISVYRIFDSHIELLWFLFPMFIFRKIFKNHFYKQISYETEKNMQRLTSDISEKINKLTDFSKDETLKYILNEINTIENALSGEQSKSEEYQYRAESLKKHIKRISE
ncbi:MAG: hypothetical protein A2275_12090 [Bacteroidetes bacterium RIFOXYA12_FULL_35_11]|nr:MAG: hypothetical protein A2X01_12960 [Bacteroidetes bacterium GWF2_35_48]OFY73629.1 MAG: hypothetical protein A2275_12090 [Bacteroidetes bacterium RIFOXYA12_FULL_35_11]OFY94611.1 MAG: hypothetical protein A2309_08460 [Bacteroidetes bacterium RIFOXYB2_FULL_35_7]HBX52404.1 hypothetical protein [Bacteroidales bacterium]